MIVAQGISDSAAARIIGVTYEQGGGTFYPTGYSVTPDKGYGLSIYPEYEKVLNLDDFTRTAITLWSFNALSFLIDRNLTLPYPHFIGTWKSDESIYLDVSMIVLNREVALSMARKAGQLAIWDYANKCEIVVE